MTSLAGTYFSSQRTCWCTAGSTSLLTGVSCLRVSSCAADADRLVAPSPAGSRGWQCAPVVMEVVPSSQGSPTDPADVIVLQPHTDVAHELLTPDEVCSSASSMVTTAFCQGSYVC